MKRVMALMARQILAVMAILGVYRTEADSAIAAFTDELPEVDTRMVPSDGPDPEEDDPGPQPVHLSAFFDIDLDARATLEVGNVP